MVSAWLARGGAAVRRWRGGAAVATNTFAKESGKMSKMGAALLGFNGDFQQQHQIA
jgi:hypothetical protein